MDAKGNEPPQGWGAIEETLEQDASLDSLRVLCRQEDNCVRAMPLVPKLCQLAAGRRAGALKVLSNICYHLPAARKSIAADKYLMKTLVKGSAEDTGEVRRLSLRLLFFLTLDPDVSDSCRTEGALSIACYDILTPATNHDDKDNKIDDETALYALRVLYNVEASLTAEHVQRILNVAVDRQQSLKVRGSAANVLLKADRVDAKVDDVTVLLTDTAGADREIVGDYLPSVARLVTRCTSLRGGLRRRMLPRDRTASQEVRQTLTRLLKSPHPELVMAIGDMLMWLVRMNVARVVYHVGYENAAGYLYMKGAQGEEEQVQLGDSSDEEEIRSHGIPGRTPTTCTPATYTPATYTPNTRTPTTCTPTTHPPPPDMTEEEKQAETDRLMDLFERLERTGVVSVLKLQKD